MKCNNAPSYSMLALALFLISALKAIPNYYDPLLILKDPYWPLHITHADIEAAIPYPRMWPEILEYIDREVENFARVAQAQTKGQRAQLFQEAADALRAIQTEAHTLLHTPQYLTHKEIEKLNALVKMQPSEFLPTQSSQKSSSSLRRIGGLINFSPRIHERITLEQAYNEWLNQLQEMTKRPRLSDENNNLLRQAQEQLERIYTCLAARLSLSKPSTESESSLPTSCAPILSPEPPASAPPKRADTSTRGTAPATAP